MNASGLTEQIKLKTDESVRGLTGQLDAKLERLGKELGIRNEAQLEGHAAKSTIDLSNLGKEMEIRNYWDLEQYEGKKRIDKRNAPALYAKGDDGQLIAIQPGADGSLPAMPVFKGGSTPGYLTQGTSKKDGKGSAGGSSAGDGSIAIFDQNGQLVDDVKYVKGKDGNMYVGKVSPQGIQLIAFCATSSTSPTARCQRPEPFG